ncbi:hypothetical protein G3I76_22750, partial [Streptomyces sp. SID11233]|nr:hypothetical protein [Streptomyces sp. SID11233]
QRLVPHTTVLTITQKAVFAHLVGARAELDNLQNIAPRLCRGLHDALTGGEGAQVAALYGEVTRLWSGTSGFVAEHGLPRVV